LDSTLKCLPTIMWAFQTKKPLHLTGQFTLSFPLDSPTDRDLVSLRGGFMKSWLTFVLFSLPACAPAPVARFSVTTVPEEVSFYPHEAGLQWTYLEPGERLDTPHFTKEYSGLRSVNNELVVLSRFYGRGNEINAFETVDASGVFLKREDRPGAVLVYQPPLQTLPAQANFKVGTQWTGNSSVSVYYPNNDTPTQVQLSYAYRILETRTVVVGGQTLEVYIIAFEARQTDQHNNVETISQEVWYAPYVGEVKTRSGLFLMDTNF
jgi:hypothetical protein